MPVRWRKSRSGSRCAENTRCHPEGERDPDGGGVTFALPPSLTGLVRHETRRAGIVPALGGVWRRRTRRQRRATKATERARWPLGRLTLSTTVWPILRFSVVL